MPTLVNELLAAYFANHYPHLTLPKQEPRCSTRFILQTTFRFCYRCIQISRYIHENWDYVFLPYCFEHNCALLDVNSLNRFWSVGYRGKLFNQSDDPESCKPIKLLHYLSYRLGFQSFIKDSSLSAFDGLTIDEFQKLIFLVGAFGSQSRLEKPRKVPIKTSAVISLEILKHAESVLIDWPKNIAYISKNDLSVVIRNRQIFNTYGAIHKALKKELVGPQYGFIKEDYEYFLLSKWPDIVDKKTTWFSKKVLSKSDFISGTEFSKSAKVNVNTITNWIEQEFIEGSIRQLNSGSRQICEQILMSLL